MSRRDPYLDDDPFTNVKEGEGGLTRKVWKFRLELEHTRQPKLHLESYLEQSRPSKRHGWNTDKQYQASTDRMHQDSDQEVMPVVDQSKIGLFWARLQNHTVFVPPELAEKKRLEEREKERARWSRAGSTHNRTKL